MSKKCIICKKEIEDEKFSPFCSQRCKNIDLGRWLNGNYVIPGEDFEKKSQKSEFSTRQEDEIDLYHRDRSPDSSVGRAED